MPANAGTIEAQLILNASQFQKQMQSAMASAQNATKSMATGSQAVTQGYNNAAKSVQTYTNSVKGATTQATYMGKAIGGTINQLSGMNKAISTASSSFTTMGNAYKTAITPVATSTSRISSALSSVGSVGSAAFGKVGSGIMAAGNSLASLTNSVVSFNVWMGALVGAAFYQFTVGATMARDESLSLFKFVGMSAGEVDRLNQSTSEYAKTASKVSQPEMLSGWRLIRLSHKMSADQMTQYNGVLGDTIGLFKANGRTAEDAGRAIEDAMAGGSDGIKRLKEIGISDMQELYDRGFDPSKPETFFAALQKLYQDKGIEGYGSKVTSLSDRFENLKEKIQLAGIAAGEALMPGMEALVNGLTAIFEGLGPQVSGLMIAFGGLTTILGFFWPTLTTIGSGASYAAGRIIELAGGTLQYKTAANGAKTSSIAWGDTLGGLNKKMVGAVAGIAVMVAALIGLAYYISQTQSATIAWSNAEKEKNELVTGLKTQNENLNKSIKSLTDARAREAAAGRSTVEIDNQIAEARKRIEQNTINATNAENAWNNAQGMKTQLEGLGQGKISSAKTRAAAAEEGITPEEYVEKHGTTAEYNDELTKTAELNAKIYTVYDRQAGTIDKINKGTDTYSRIMKSNSAVFQEYKQDYDDYAKSSEAFFLALEKGDIGGMIKEGVMSGFFQFKLALVEAKVSFMAWIEDTSNQIKKPFQDAYTAIVTPIQNAFNTVKGAWDSFWAGLADTGVITELQTAFVEVKSAVETLKGTFLEVKEAFGDVWNELSGAFNEIKSAFGDVWNELSAPISDLVNAFKELIWPAKEVGGAVQEVGNTAQENKEPLITLKDVIKWVADGIRATIPYIRMFADGIRWVADRVMELAEFLRWVADRVRWMSAQFSSAVAWIQGAWSGAVNFLQVMWDYVVNFVITRWNAAVGAVTGNPLVARMWDWASGIIKGILDTWNWVKGEIEKAPIIGKLIGSGGPPQVGGGDSGGGGGAFTGPPRNMSRAFLNYASGFKYVGYGGIGQTISQTLASGAGNCVDGSLAQIALANMWGIPAELIQTTWMGNPHVYARIAGQDRDIANHALTGSWRAPPRGPRGNGGGNYYDLRGATILDGKSFEKMVEKANGNIIRGY